MSADIIKFPSPIADAAHDPVQQLRGVITAGREMFGTNGADVYDDELSELGQRVAKLRKMRGFATRAEFARHARLSQQLLTMIESGQRQPGLRVLEQLAKSLECTIDYLVNGAG